jgi:hypothetical protein
MRIFQAMGNAAQHQAKKQPTHDDLYPVTVLMNAAGEIVCDDENMPLVVIPPLTVACTDDKTVEFPNKCYRRRRSLRTRMCTRRQSSGRSSMESCPSPRRSARVEWRIV